MSRIFSRTDKSFLSQWWWTVNHGMLGGVVLLIILGFLMALAASPAVAQHIGKPIYFFAYKQLAFLFLAFAVFLVVSMLPALQIRRLAYLVCAVALLAVVATLFFGVTVKGASRWLLIGGLSVQPAEFLKPSFVVVCAALMAKNRAHLDGHGTLQSFILLAAAALLLSLQPDIGQMTLLCLVWCCLYFLAGGALGRLSLLVLIGGAMACIFYVTMPHVASRIDRFFDPASGDTYQVDRAMDAIKSGGLVGVGPGNGQVKSILPDAHSDYVFAVAAEEGGLLWGAFIISVFGYLVWRGLTALRDEYEHWIQLSAAGLICMFGLQAVINLAVNLNLIPSKGMTLPFLSYGGSSLLASALTMGMLVGLMRRRAGTDMRMRRLNGLAASSNLVTHNLPTYNLPNYNMEEKQ